STGEWARIPIRGLISGTIKAGTRWTRSRGGTWGPGGSSTRLADLTFVSGASGARLEDHVRGRLRHAPNPPEARVGQDLAQPCLSRLGAQREAHLLAERRGCAEQRRRAVVEASDRIEVVLEPIVRHGLDEHPGPPGSERLAHMARGSDRIAHVVEAVE